MTQSLIRTAPDAAHWLHVNGRPLSGTHAQIVSILRSRLGHNHGALLAQPHVAADGSVAWTTPLAGPALRAIDLPTDERDALVKRAERMLADVRNLAAQMRAEGTTGTVVAAILEQAVQVPPGDWLYSVDGKPVYVMWGHGSGAAPDPATAGLATAAAAVPADAPAAAAAAVAGSALPASAPLQASVAPGPGPGPGPVPSPAAAPAVAAATVAATAATEPTGAGTPAMARRPWLLAAAALLLLAALLFGWSRCSSPGAADLSATIAQAEERNRALEDELARRRAAQMQCVPDPAEPPPPVLPERPVALAPPEPPASEPPAVVPENPPSRPVARAPPRPEPTPPPAKPVMPQMPDLSPAPAPASTPRATPPAPTRQACKPMRPGDEPEVIMIVDASGSMREGLGNMSRLEAAKRAADSMIRGLPAPVDVGLVDFTACNQVRRDKFYSAPERGALIGEINALSPKAGTPLAQAIERAGRVASDSAEAVLVVVSDGGDSCGGDPCGAARRLKAQRPNVVINVIDLSTSSSDRAVLQCVASAGGGRVLRPGDPLDMQQKMKEAAGSAACTP